MVVVGSDGRGAAEEWTLRGVHAGMADGRSLGMDAGSAAKAPLGAGAGGARMSSSRSCGAGAMEPDWRWLAGCRAGLELAVVARARAGSADQRKG